MQVAEEREEREKENAQASDEEARKAADKPEDAHTAPKITGEQLLLQKGGEVEFISRDHA